MTAVDHETLLEMLDRLKLKVKRKLNSADVIDALTGQLAEVVAGIRTSR